MAFCLDMHCGVFRTFKDSQITIPYVQRMLSAQICILLVQKRTYSKHSKEISIIDEPNSDFGRH